MKDVERPTRDWPKGYLVGDLIGLENLSINCQCVLLYVPLKDIRKLGLSKMEKEKPKDKED